MESVLNIYLARHGQDEDNAAGILNGHRDNPLTLKGIEQAEGLAAHIKEVGIYFDAVYASPLRRAFQTAEIIATCVNAPKPIVLDLIIERNFGVMTGKPIASIKETCAPGILQVGQLTYFLTVDGAESFPELYERAGKALDFVRAAHSSGNILLVAHGDIGKMLYGNFYSIDWLSVIKNFHFGNSELLLCSPLSPAEETHVFSTEQFNH